MSVVFLDDSRIQLEKFSNFTKIRTTSFREINMMIELRRFRSMIKIFEFDREPSGFLLEF